MNTATKLCSANARCRRPRLAGSLRIKMGSTHLGDSLERRPCQREVLRRDGSSLALPRHLKDTLWILLLPVMLLRVRSLEGHPGLLYQKRSSLTHWQGAKSAAGFVVQMEQSSLGCLVEVNQVWMPNIHSYHFQGHLPTMNGPLGVLRSHLDMRTGPGA